MNKKLQFCLKSKKTMTAILTLVLATGVLIPLSQGFSADTKSTTASNKIYTAQNEVRGVWLSYYEMDALLKGKSKDEFRNAFSKVCQSLSKDQMNTIFVQVRPFGDAVYKSSVYPTSYLVTGTEGVELPFDPLTVMIEEAKKNKLKIEAWVNPYRVRINSIKAPISEKNLMNAWLKDGSNRVVQTSGGIFYNPSDADVRKLVVSGVKELVKNYALDGIHFDDYFYPTTAASFDKPEYDAYLKAGGKMSLADFRRDQINLMVKEVYTVCKSGKKSVRFGISPQGLIKNNYDSQYADVEKWVKNKGYVDYICPQIYFGFKNSKAPFEKVLGEWNTLTKNAKVDVYIGLAPYKLGVNDKYAGTGKDEWLTDSKILANMVKQSRTLAKYKGVVLFRYDNLWNPPKELQSTTEAERIALVQLFMNKTQGGL